jgi:hypothetical protein
MHGLPRYLFFVRVTDQIARVVIATKHLGPTTILRAADWPEGAYGLQHLLAASVPTASSTGQYIGAFSDADRACRAACRYRPTGAATTAAINAKRSNRIVASLIALLLQGLTSLWLILSR